jgi:hypothetical protein
MESIQAEVFLHSTTSETLPVNHRSGVRYWHTAVSFCPALASKRERRQVWCTLHSSCTGKWFGTRDRGLEAADLPTRLLRRAVKRSSQRRAGFHMDGDPQRRRKEDEGGRTTRVSGRRASPVEAGEAPLGPHKLDTGWTQAGESTRPGMGSPSSPCPFPQGGVRKPQPRGRPVGEWTPP